MKRKLFRIYWVNIFQFTDNREDSDNDDWETREQSRVSQVKFSDDSATDKDTTPFVRQNTPHPKELKAKAHKLFGKDKKDDEILTTMVEVSCRFLTVFFK